MMRIMLLQTVILTGKYNKYSFQSCDIVSACCLLHVPFVVWSTIKEQKAIKHKFPNQIVS